jgi:hypothetical protein
VARPENYFSDFRELMRRRMPTRIIVPFSTDFIRFFPQIGKSNH